MAPEIAVHRLKRMRDEKLRHALLDVRERGEIYLRQLFGVTPVPRGLLELRVPALLPTRDVPVVVMCDGGRRSQLAAETLERMGYEEVGKLAGGMRAWVEAGLPTVEGIGVPGKEYGEMVAVTQRIPQLTPEELAARWDRGERLLILDARTVEEYRRGHLPGAYSVPGGELPFAVFDLATDPDTTIVVNCAGRTRSILGAQLLLRMRLPNPVFGFKNGTMAWEMSGFELERGEGRSGPRASPKARDAAEVFAAGVAEEDGLRYLSVDELRHLRESGQPHYLVDVRLPEEYSHGHISGAVSCPAGQLALASEEVVAVADAPIVFVCDGQARATIAASLFTRMGFPRVSILRGGLGAWLQAGHPLEEGTPRPEVFGLRAAGERVATVSSPQLRARLDQGEAPALLDARSSGEYALGHIAGSISIARGNLEQQLEGELPDRSGEIVAICDDGTRSTLAAATLRDLGYMRATVLEGGTKGWQQAGLALEEGLQGARVTLEFAKLDVPTVQRTGILARNRTDMERYLSWEEKLGERYEGKPRPE